MKKFVAILIASLFVGTLVADDIKVSVNWKKLNLTGTKPYPQITVVSKVDSITIRDIRANKGRCAVSYSPVPAKLGYGDSVTASFTWNTCSNLMDIEVVTDKGSYNYEID